MLKTKKINNNSVIQSSYQHFPKEYKFQQKLYGSENKKYRKTEADTARKEPYKLRETQAHDDKCRA